MKKLLTLILSTLTLGLAACNSGSSTTSPPQTQYEFTNISYGGSGSCASIGNVATCPTGASTLNLNISYTSKPASYLVIPTQLPSGVTVSSSGTCNTTATTNYGPCAITITGNNPTSGSSVVIAINGSLGQQTFFTVNYLNLTGN